MGLTARQLQSYSSTELIAALATTYPTGERRLKPGPSDPALLDGWFRRGTIDVRELGADTLKTFIPSLATQIALVHGGMHMYAPSRATMALGLVASSAGLAGYLHASPARADAPGLAPLAASAPLGHAATTARCPILDAPGAARLRQLQVVFRCAPLSDGRGGNRRRSAAAHCHWPRARRQHQGATHRTVPRHATRLAERCRARAQARRADAADGQLVSAAGRGVGPRDVRQVRRGGGCGSAGGRGM